MPETIYTVDQTARILGLHPRTVRRFIREGKLEARKVGGQWRITDRELQRFSGTGEGTASPGLQPEPAPGVRVSAVVDIMTNMEEAIRLANTLMAVLNTKGSDGGEVRCDHIYHKEEGRAQFLLWGRPLMISKLLQIIHEITR